MSTTKKEQPYLPLSTSPTSVPESSPPIKSRSTLKTTMILISLITLLPLFHFSPSLLPHLKGFRHFRPCHSHSHLSSKSIAQCPVQFPALNVGGISFNPKEDEEYKLRAVERFKGAIRIVSIFCKSGV